MVGKEKAMKIVVLKMPKMFSGIVKKMLKF